jgi:hypothetical protein
VKIPDLINTAGLAAATGRTRSEISVLFSMGLIPGRQIAEKTTVFRKGPTLKLLQDSSQLNNAVRDEEIPDLVNSEVAAGLRGISRQRLDKLRQEGRIPARVVSPRLVLYRRSVAEGIVTETPVDGPVTDLEIPELVDRVMAAEMLSVVVGTLGDYYRGGLIPGAKYDSGESVRKREAVVFRRAVIEALVKEIEELPKGAESPLARRPVDDPKIPELLTSGQAGELLGGNRETARNRYMHGHLPGKEIEGGPGEPKRLVFRREAVEAHRDVWDRAH